MFVWQGGRRLTRLKTAFEALLERMSEAEAEIMDKAPSSETLRLNQAFDLIGELQVRVANTAPASEIERLNKAFDLIAERAPASEIERLNKAFELIAERAPASETKRLDIAFEMISQLAPASETKRIDYAIESIGRPSERIVEVPWTLSKYQGEKRVLEVGHAYAEEHYLRSLGLLGIPFLVGIDAAPSLRAAESLAPFLQVRADVLDGCFRPDSFELILCISTIEHIGRDNTVYGLDSGRQAERPDVEAISAMREWLIPGGRLLLTVPYGRYEERETLINYDEAHLNELIAASGLQVSEKRFFGWFPGGWAEADGSDLAHHGYQALGASYASGVALIELRHPRRSDSEK